MGSQVEHISGYKSQANLVLESEVSEIRLLLQEYAGVLIDRPSAVIACRVGEFVASQHLSSVAELIGAIRARPAECENLLAVLLPADTGFFRTPEVFEIFRSEVLPAISGRKGEERLRPLRIWSAGCASGEEAYSIGITLCEAFHGDSGGWNVHIVAGDIRRDALKTAERGLYPASSLLQVPGHVVASYFARVGDHFLVKPRLRNLVTFTCMNLIEPAFIGRFDCIFCLDVLPHLSASGRAALLQRLQLALEPGGHIFLGEHEQFPAAAAFIRHAAAGCTYYQRPLAAAAKAGG
jgi:chemotaxis methyl-accepting protein methylase